MRAKFILLALICALLAPIAGLRAQETMNLASLSGQVTDPSGAVIVGAEITVRQTDTNRASLAATDQDGLFRFPYLTVGQYEIRVRQSGFADAISLVRLSIGAPIDLSIQLAIKPTAIDVLVVDDKTAVLETARSQIAGTLSREEVGDLPVNGRNYQDLALTIPGVSPTNTASAQLFPETSAVPGQGISVNSQRNFSNGFIVDGLSANDDAAGLSGVLYGLDVVHEFQVVTSGGQAEFGRALGGFVNMVTKSGTNSLHGDVYGYLRNRRFNASNALSQAAMPMTQAQYGASLGGPIRRDRTFYFSNFEQRMLNQTGLVTVSPNNVSAINARLVAVNYPGPLIATGLYPNPVHSTNFLAKVDHQLNAGNQFTIRYSLYDVHSRNSRGAGGLSTATASAGLDDTDQTIAASDIAVVSSRIVNEARAQLTLSHLKAPPSDSVGPAVNISGVASFGTLSGSPTARSNKLYEVVDNLSYQAGRHALRLGVDFLYNETVITYPRSIRGSYSFSSLANFVKGIYNSSGFTQTFGNPVVSQINPNVGFYIQDEWKASRKVTLNVGLRYDLQFLQTISTDTNNISPRVGFAWVPFKSRATIIRGSYGLFYDRVPLRALANALLSAGNTTDVRRLSQIGVSLTPTQDRAPVFPHILSAPIPSVTLPNITTLDSRMQNAYSGQASFEIEQQFGPRHTLSVGYQHVRGTHLILSINRNVPSCVASGGNNGCRPNPAYANNSQYSPRADSHYDGLHASFMRKQGGWGDFRVSYTYSKALDNVGEFFFSSPIDNFNVWKDYGRSDDDQRHRLVFEGTVRSGTRGGKSAWERLRRGFQLSSILQYYSALPFNITAGSNTIQGTAARPMVHGDYLTRNAGEGFEFFSLSARLTRAVRVTERLRLEAIAEVFNALNHVNGITRNGTFGSGAYPLNPSPTFNQTTAVGDARTFQFALRMAF
jgi:hypothetical protein